MRAIAATVPIEERNSPSIPGPNHGQPPQDRGYGQHIHDLLSGKGFVDQFGAALGDPGLWQGAACLIEKHYVTLTYVITYYGVPDGSSFIS